MKTAIKLTIMCLLVALLAGCTAPAASPSPSAATPSAGTTAPSATDAPATTEPVSTEPVPLSIYLTNQGRSWNDSAPNLIAIQERANVKLDVSIAESGAGSDKFSLLLASGDLPDLSFASAMTYQEYLPSGMFQEISQLLEDHGPNLLANIPEEAWELTKYRGETYVVPYSNMGSKYLTQVRKDWLDNLNLTVPTNTDEFRDMLVAFTNDDPDGNGKKDTYGLGNATGVEWIVNLMPIFGAFGGMPGQNYAYDNQVLPYALTDEYREALTYIADLWSLGVIDPEFFILQQAQATQKMAQGIAGCFSGWWSISTQTLVLQLQMDQLSPGVEWTMIQPELKGPGGKGGMRDQGSINGTWMLSKDSSVPETAIKYLDFLATDEGFYLSSYGVKDVDYTEENGFVYRTETGKAAYEARWLDVLGQSIRRQDLLNLQQNSPTEDAAELLPRPFRNYVNSGDIYLYTDLFYGQPITDEYTEYGADLDAFLEQSAIDFITGQKDLSDASWNEYVDAYKSKGGDRVLESQVKQMNEVNGTSYTSGLN